MKIDFAFLDSVRIGTFLRPRDGEKKIGEHIFYASESIEKSLADFTGQYVILGVEEDIGPCANLGNSGAIYAFKSFLNRFLNMQDNRFINLNNVMMLGRVKAETLETGFAKRRQNVAELDAYLIDILLKVYAAGKIPIIVGGGHNNAYPLIAAYHKSRKQAINVLNLDAHADFRPLEGRHSGNAFSYAMHEKMIKSYTIHGLHSAYCNEEMLQELDKNLVQYTRFEEYLVGNRNLSDDATEFARKNQKAAFGIELDLDAIAFMPSSAYTPTGWTVSEARLWLCNLTRENAPAYLNLTEGSCELNTWSDAILGKTLAYLVSDLIARPRNSQE